MADFQQAFKVTMGIEGGYANDPRDRGGETYKGIARNRHPDWAGWKIVDGLKGPSFEEKLEENQLLQAHVGAFYKNEFWDALELDQVNNQAIATELFDTAVNMGQGRAVEFLQRVLNVLNRNGRDYPDLKLDHQMGTKTLQTLNKSKAQNLVLLLLNVLQGAKYVEIAEHDPSQEIFMRSWLSRIITDKL